MADEQPRRPVTGATRLAAVIGWPVRHSRSPLIHNAAFAATGLDWTYLALPVAPGDAATAIDGMRALGIDGLSVTMPHKHAVAASVDRLTDDAAALGAVNCVYRDGDALVGDNTDGGGFVDALRHDEGIDVAGMTTVVVGAGGAARAVVRALAQAGADAVVVANRTPARAEATALLAGNVGSAVELAALAGPLGAADLVVNATPVGMGEGDGSTPAELPFRPDALGVGAVVADLVYHPLVTPLLERADELGHRTVGGLGMLVHQAARAFTRWTGEPAPIQTMRDAAHQEPG